MSTVLPGIEKNVMPGRLGWAAPAKINLALHVTGRRADGYHLLESLVVFTRYGDRLQAKATGADSFSVSGPFAPSLPCDRGNLVVRARDLMRRRFGAEAAAPVALHLEKNLPIASGIGGGSSDAAAALGLLARFWDLKAASASLSEIALELGADVPMCLYGTPLLARGIGANLEPLDGLPALPVVLVNPGLPLATPAVFAALLNRKNPPLPPFRAHGGNLAEIVDWLKTTRNDLEAPALSLMPEIGGVLSRLRAEGARLARMSGSGATCIGIFSCTDEAERAAATIAGKHPDWFVRATSTTMSVPETHHA